MTIAESIPQVEVDKFFEYLPSAPKFISELEKYLCELLVTSVDHSWKGDLRSSDPNSPNYGPDHKNSRSMDLAVMVDSSIATDGNFNRNLVLMGVLQSIYDSDASFKELGVFVESDHFHITRDTKGLYVLNYMMPAYKNNQIIMHCTPIGDMFSDRRWIPVSEILKPFKSEGS